jgi:hypothetical protein
MNKNVILYDALYSQFWEKFRLVTRGRCLCYPDAQLTFESRKNSQNVQVHTLKELILLKGLPTRCVGESVDAIVDFEEYYNTRNLQLPLRTSVSVFYFSRKAADQRRATPLYGLRFDYAPETGKLDGDPIMHVQITTDQPRSRPRPYQDVEMANFLNPQDPIVQALKMSHIPSPRMPLPGVLCFLVADHLREGVVHQLIGQAHAILPLIPTPTLCATWFKTQFTIKQDLTGWTWYKY